MSNILNLKGVKLFAIIVLAAALLATFGMVAVQKASADCSIMSTLRVGSTGVEVQCLQSIVGATADGKFGPMTQAAVMAWQSGHGLVADGVVGPLSRAALMGAPSGNFPAGCTSASGFSPTTGTKCDSGPSNSFPAGCSSASGFSSTTGVKCDGSGGGGASSGPLTGGAGSITVSAKSTYNSETVVAGDNDAKVLAFEVEADDNSDVDVTSVKVELKQTVGTNSDRIDDYMDSVSIWMGSTKVGESDASDFSENSNIYTKSIPLTGAVVRAGVKQVFVVAINALNNLDSGDINDDSFGVDVLNVRFKDGEGVVTTEDTDANVLDRTFDFDDLSTSGDLELKLTEATGNPDAMSVEVDDTTDTDVTMLKFNLKATGSDMNVDSMELNTLALGVDSTFVDMVSEISLMHGTDELDSVSTALVAQDDGVDNVMGTADDVAGTIQFTDLDLDIGEGDTENFSIVAKIRDTAATTGATVFDAGDSLTVSFLGTGNLDDLTNTDIEDANGDNVVAGDRTGSVTGNAQTFYTDGVTVAFVSTDAQAFTVDAVNNDRAELTIKFKVTAFGGDAYIPSLITVTSAGTGAAGTAPTVAQGTGLHLQSSDGQLTTAKGSAILTSTAEETAYTPTGTDTTDNAYTSLFKVDEGSTETFTAKVTVDNAVATAGDLDGAQVRAILTGVSFSSGTNVITTAGVLVYTSNLQDDFKTAYATIAD
jgi:peptidoglycan hydrolase-like protein with peptidoglycan-binding domain